MRLQLLSYWGRRTAVWIFLVYLVAGASGLVFSQQAAQEGEVADKSANFSIVIKDILGNPRHGRVTVRPRDGRGGLVVPCIDGIGVATLEEGKYIARVEVYDGLVPYVVSIREFEIADGIPFILEHEVLEGTTGGARLGAFDADGDLVIDSAELELGADPRSAMSIPGVRTHEWPAQVKTGEPGWLKGELHAHSNYGSGTESVSDVIKRAEKAGLDFLAILDRNTLGSALDKDYTSKKMVMIPGMEWGDDRNGVALVYAPGSMPPPVGSNEEMDAHARLIQAQGGLVFAGHPCFPSGPWNRQIQAMNGVEAWCMGWRAIPPIATGYLLSENLERLPDTDLQGKIVKGNYVYPIARAAHLPAVSANAQATAYWDFEMQYGRTLTLIGGSQSGHRKVEIGAPVTYVYAQERSLQGILDGLRLGRTFVSEDSNGPTIDWIGDIFDDGTIDVGVGGSVPVEHPTKYYVRVKGAKGKKLEIMTNGAASISTEIDLDDWVFPYVFTPEGYEVYKVRIVSAPQDKGYGYREVHAMSSPIYADVIIHDKTVEGADIGTDGWVKIENEYMAPAQIDAFMEQIKANSSQTN